MNNTSKKFTPPQLLDKTIKLDEYLKTLSPKQLSKIMNISPALAVKTYDLIKKWTSEPREQRAVIDSFIGDIYSGLQVNKWSQADRDYANKTLRILSGLYGILKPLDGICPYRLEMGYQLPEKPYANLYEFWGRSIASTLPSSGPIINLAAVEYSKTVTPFVDPARIITPIFRTVSPKTGEPTFVTVHAKIARGAFARWLIINKIENLLDIPNFDYLGYHYDKKNSSPQSPLFVCRDFGGKGLSMRLT